MRMAGHLNAKNTSKTTILLFKVRIARIGDPSGSLYEHKVRIAQSGDPSGPLSELFNPSERAEDSAAAVGTVMDLLSLPMVQTRS